MISQMANPFSRLFRPRSTSWRCFSSLRNIGPRIPFSNWSTISQSLFSSPRETVDDVKSPFLGIRSVHVSSTCGIGNKKIWPFCQPHHQNNWPLFSSSRTRSEVSHRKSPHMNEDEVTVDCQRGQEVLKDFLMSAESRDMQVSSTELVQAVDDVMTAVYSNGKYPFMARYDIFQDRSKTGKMGTTGKTGILHLFREQWLLEDFVTCPEIESLLSLINDNLPAMTASDKAHLYFSLNYLGIHEQHVNHPVMHKLFYVLTEPAGELNYEDLRKFIVVLETLYNTNVVRYQFLLPHFKHLNSVGILTGLERQQFIRAISYTGRSYPVMETPHHQAPVNFSQIWHALVTDENIMKSPENIVSILNHTGFHAQSRMIPQVIKNNIFERIGEGLLQQMDDLDIRTLAKISVTNRYFEFPHFSATLSGNLRQAFLDRWEKILHNTPNMSTVEMLSVMDFYRLDGFHLSQESLAILINHMEKNFPELQPIYSANFLKMLGFIIRKHKKENIAQFDNLLTLMNTDSDAEMFQSNYMFEILLVKWRIFCLSPEAFRTYMLFNLLFKRGFGWGRRLLPIAMEYMENKLDDDVMKKELMERIVSVCEGEQHVRNLFLICFNLMKNPETNIDKCEHTEFYAEILQLINRKLTDSVDLKEVATCFSKQHDIRVYHRKSVMIKETLSNLVDKVSQVILLPHKQTDAVSLAENINHHYYNLGNDFLQITTPAVDQLTTNLLEKEHTCDLDSFVALTNLIACGVMSTSKRQELEQFAEVLFEENMDFMKIDSLLLALDNLCLAGVFPQNTLKAVLSTDFLEVLDQCISSKSERVISTEHIEYHLLRLNRSVVLDCPSLDIPWFCGHIGAVHSAQKPKYLRYYLKMTEDALASILGGEQFFRVNSTTGFKHTVDFQCFISPHGYPVQLAKIDSDAAVPATIQKVAIDVLPDNLWGSNPDVMYQEKKRHLKKEGYKYIQVRRDVMRGLALSKKGQLREYYTNKIFS